MGRIHNRRKIKLTLFFASDFLTACKGDFLESCQSHDYMYLIGEVSVTRELCMAAKEGEEILADEGSIGPDKAVGLHEVPKPPLTGRHGV